MKIYKRVVLVKWIDLHIKKQIAEICARNGVDCADDVTDTFDRGVIAGYMDVHDAFCASGISLYPVVEN